MLPFLRLLSGTLFVLLPGTLTPLGATPAEPRREPIPIFSRAQLKYGLERTDYASRWVDRPLYVNPALADPDTDHPGHLARASYRKIQEIVMQYGLRGLAFFPENYRGSTSAYQLTEEHKIPGFELLTDFSVDKSEEDYIGYAGMALANPASFRIDGKVVIVSYLADARPPDYWRKLFTRIREEHGDHFIFLPTLIRFAGETTTHWIPRFDAGTISEEQQKAIRDGIRQWVRATDGLYFESTASMKTTERNFHEAFYRDFIIRYMREVLAEPEFAGKKYFGLSACIGHENCTRFGYTLSSDGTATLRRSLEAALEARPDVIVIPEWDESNENTSLRPTVYNGRTAMRLLRHYTSQEKGELSEPLPGETIATPNLILSYRKLLMLGEALKLELLHVPEKGTVPAWKVTLELLDPQGKTVHSTKALSVEKGKLWSHDELLPSERFAAHRYLLPRLKVEDGEGKELIYENFQPIDLRPSWNWDYKWVMQPVREILQPKEYSFKVTPGEGSVLEVEASFTADEPLAYVEVLDNDDVVYSYQTTNPLPRENASQAVFRVDWQSLEWLGAARRINGTLTLKGAEGEWKGNRYTRSEGKTLHLNDAPTSIWVQRAVLSVSQKELEEAKLEINLPGIWKGELPLKEVHASGIYGIPGTLGFNLVISRFLRLDHLPEHLNTDSASFRVPILPDLPSSRLGLQAIAVSGKIYRGRPFITGTPTGKMQSVKVFSDHERQPREVKVDSNRVPPIIYEFTPEATGSILKTSAGRPLWGILGGFSTQATGRGGAESRDGTPFLRPEHYPGNITGEGKKTDLPPPASAPKWEEIEPGVHALVFNGESTFVTLPQGAIPRRAGYELTLDFLPDHAEGEQLLLSNRSYYQGTIAISIEEGQIIARFLDDRAEEFVLQSGLHVELGQWNRLKVRYDQARLELELNDTPGSTLAVPGPGLFDTVTTIGGYNRSWFAGKIRSLRIDHAP